MDPVDVDIANYDCLSDLGDPDDDLDLDHDHDGDDGDFSDAEIDKFYLNSTNRLFGRQRPLHLILGGGSFADIILWRNKEISACILGGATVLWLLFEWMNFHFLSLFCNVLLLSLASFFIWSNLAAFINVVPPPEFPDVTLPEGSFVEAALLLRHEFHQAIRALRDDVILGTDFKRFLLVTCPLGVFSVLGSWFNFLTLSYLVTVILMTMPMLYESYEDSVDDFVEKSLVEMKKQYTLLDEKVHHTLQNISSC